MTDKGNNVAGRIPDRLRDVTAAMTRFDDAMAGLLEEPAEKLAEAAEVDGLAVLLRRLGVAACGLSTLLERVRGRRAEADPAEHGNQVAREDRVAGPLRLGDVLAAETRRPDPVDAPHDRPALPEVVHDFARNVQALTAGLATVLVDADHRVQALAQARTRDAVRALAALLEEIATTDARADAALPTAFRVAARHLRDAAGALTTSVRRIDPAGGHRALTDH